MGHYRNTIIFSTDAGIIALDSPVKLKILQILRKGMSSFDELVEQSGKAKSTISVHLDDLEEMNLIQEKTYPEDKRKKYYTLNSICLACSEIPLRNHYNRYLDNMALSGVNGISFITCIFHTVRYGMEAYGFDPKPILKRLGNDIGKKIGPELESDDCDGVLDELSIFWKKYKLGGLTVIHGNNPVIQVTDCYHCSMMPNVGKTLCSMDEGIFEGVLLSKLKLECSVKETECFGTGYHHCRFVVEKK